MADEISPLEAETKMVDDSSLKITSFDVFDKARNETSETAVKETVAETEETEELTEEIEEVKEEVREEKKEVTETEEEEGEEKEVAKKETPKLAAKRDYSGIEEADVPYFKKMGNDAFAKAKGIYLENRELKDKLSKADNNPHKLPPNYYSHPDAVKLSPAYVAQETAANNVKMLRDHWVKQTISLKRDGTFRNLTPDAQGRIMVSEPIKADEDQEAKVLDLAEEYKELASTEKRKLEDMKTSFSSKVAGDVKFLKDTEDKFFPGFDDEKHPTYKLQAEVKKSLPESFKDIPTTSLLVKSCAALIVLRGELDKANAELSKYKSVKSDAKKAPPTKKSFSVGGGNSGNGKISSMEDFMKARMDGVAV